MEFVAVWLIVGVIGVGAWWLAHEMARRRRLRFEVVARQLGLHYHPTDPFGTVDMPFEAFRRGHSRKVDNILVGTGPGGGEVRAFDYRYTTGSGKNQTTHTKTGILVATGGAWPHMRLSRENFFSRAGDALGLRDLELESEEFNQTFEVHCDDGRFATAFLDPQMMHHLLAAGIDDSVEIHGPWALHVYHRHDPEQLVGLVQHATALGTRIPPVVWDLYPGPRA